MSDVFARRLAAAIVCAAILLPLGCEKSSPTEPHGTRAWIQTLIAQIQSQPVTNPPSAIYSYTYREETVYYRPGRCCDIAGVLYDRHGEFICEPDGGITGRGDGLCPDFAQASSNRMLIWRDTRS